MKESYLFDMPFNNIVFLGRNKAYGAYLLRKNYSRHLTVATIVGSLVFIALILMPMISSMYTEKAVSAVPIPDDKTLTGTVVELPPKPPKPKVADIAPVQPQKEKVATKKYVAPKVVENSVETPDDVPDQGELQKAVISTRNQEGIAPETPTMDLPTELPEGLGTGTGEKEEPYIFVEQMPQFGKGEADLITYVSKNIRYPTRARNAGVEGLVVVSFVVTATGEVTDVQVLNGLGYGTEEEAIRVIKGMPKWKPGKQNGRAVPVRYTLPIRLQMQN